MLHLNNILFPTDFSPCAEEAFGHAIHLATDTGATVHVLTVVGDEADDRPMEYLPLETADDGSGLYYEPDDEDHDEPVRIVYHQIQDTSPSEAIVNRIDESAIDLVVMGTHGRRGADRLLSGSVAEEVVRRASCPVFTVLCQAATDASDDPHLKDTDPIRNIVVPVDLSEHTPSVIAHAEAVAALYGATIHLLHVVEDVAYPTVYGIDPLTPVLPDVMERAEESLQRYAQTLHSDSGLTVETHVVTGYAAQDIVHSANELNADLILMGTHGRTGLRRFLIGSVAEKVVRRTPCPVFIVKNFGPSVVDDPEAEMA